jgi:glycerate 2-kinase
VRGDGRGGRNQELALASVHPIAASEADLVLASIGTDGIDGPTDAAGALVDSDTRSLAETRGVDLARALASNDAYPALDALGALVRTGPTGTNVGDLQVVVVSRGMSV